MENYRLFISYQHSGDGLANRIAAHIEKLGLTPFWDRKLSEGGGFSEQIKKFIRHSHVFLPVITETTNSGWVHEEIGYAMALNVPVIPITVSVPPGQMLGHLHAIKLPGSDADLNAVLTRDQIVRIISDRDLTKSALYSCADEAEERAAMITSYAEDVLQLGYFGKVRQRGGLSSFHIPHQVIQDPVWRLRYGGMVRSNYHCSLQREERLALAKHANRAGARIMISPDLKFMNREARIVRLECLVDFLNSASDNIEVACTPVREIGESITIVGDWFFSASVSGTLQAGFRQTIFTSHAAAIRRKMNLFDEEFDHAQQTMPWPGEGSSRERARAYLEILINQLKSEL